MFVRYGYAQFSVLFLLNVGTIKKNGTTSCPRTIQLLITHSRTEKKILEHKNSA